MHNRRGLWRKPMRKLFKNYRPRVICNCREAHDVCWLLSNSETIKLAAVLQRPEIKNAPLIHHGLRIKSLLTQHSR